MVARSVGHEPNTGAASYWRACEPSVAASPEAPGADAGLQTELFERAIDLFRAGDFAQAKIFFERAANGPLRDMAHSARVHARICQQRTSRDGPSLQDAEDHYNYGIALLNSGNLESAAKHLETAVELSPDKDHYHYSFALCCGLQNDFEKAYAHLQRAIELWPQNRTLARHDPDFARLSNLPPLQKLLSLEQSGDE